MLVLRGSWHFTFCGCLPPPTGASPYGFFDEACPRPGCNDWGRGPVSSARQRSRVWPRRRNLRRYLRKTRHGDISITHARTYKEDGRADGFCQGGKILAVPLCGTGGLNSDIMELGTQSIAACVCMMLLPAVSHGSLAISVDDALLSIVLALGIRVPVRVRVID